MRPSPLESSAQRWGVAPRLAGTLFWVPLVVSAALLFLPVVHGSLGSDARWLLERGFDVVLSEDGPVEWAQVAGFAAACLGAALAGRRGFRSGAPCIGRFFTIVALGFFWIVGEEISWGQRIVGVLTPDWLSAVNEQDELNLHNVTGVREFLDYPRIAIGLWGVFGGLCAGWLARRGALAPLARAGFPLSAPLFLVPAFGVMLAYDALRATLWRESGTFLRLVRYGEWPELCFALGVGTFFLLAQRRMTQVEAPKPQLKPLEQDRLDPAA